jgi:hypothetical protein
MKKPGGMICFCVSRRRVLVRAQKRGFTTEGAEFTEVEKTQEESCRASFV